MIDKNNEFHRLLVSRIENYSYKINKIIFSRFISTKADPLYMAFDNILDIQSEAVKIRTFTRQQLKLAMIIRKAAIFELLFGNWMMF